MPHDVYLKRFCWFDVYFKGFPNIQSLYFLLGTNLCGRCSLHVRRYYIIYLDDM